MEAHQEPARVAVVVHPTREIEGALRTLEAWAAEHGLDVVQITVRGGSDREVARRAALEPGDLVVALGGDGTVLAALRAAACENVPVLGVACGSLGALTAVRGDALERALERVLSGDWTPRRLPAIAVHPNDAPDEWALNDCVVVRRGAAQLVVSLFVDDELYVRLAGDGLIVASPLGSSAYSLAGSGASELRRLRPRDRRSATPARGPRIPPVPAGREGHAGLVRRSRPRDTGPARATAHRRQPARAGARRSPAIY